MSLAARLATLLKSAGIPDAELGIVFVGDRAIRTLNRRYRGKDRATDVLSFPLRNAAFPHIQPQMLGDIVISVPTAYRQAARSGHPLDREIDRLVVHGLVHLLGHDHEKGVREARIMNMKERRYQKRMAP